MSRLKDSNTNLPDFDTKTNPFGENVSADHAYKRTERIAAAIYLVTNHVQENEPLRQKLRTLGHAMLSQVITLRSGFQAATHERRNTLLATVRESISLVHLLRLSGYVSQHNAQLLIHALDDLALFLSGSQHSALSDGVHLQREDFVPTATQKTIQRTVAMNESRGSIAKESSISAAPVKKEPKTPGRAVQVEVHNERHQLLKDILMKGGPLGIKDIASQMVNCSEKTVQRELAVLIKQNAVKKTGEKRWSSYELV